MSYNETINYLYNLQKYGIKFGLDNISRLMSALDNPHKSFLSIHIAGTNGKGSTSAIIASILKAAGLRVGLFTSPHLVSFTERIRVNGEEITEEEVVSLTEEIKTKIENTPSLLLPPRGGGQGWGGEPKLNPTFFEFIAAMAMLYFKRKEIDIAVIEVGMGGRLDATNIITPEVSVITNISYDHREFLGNTLKEIANEKAGIIKKGIPVVSSLQNVEAEDVIKTVADEKGSPLFIYSKDFKGILKSSNLEGITFDYFDRTTTLKNLFLSLVGEHQLVNSCIAIKAAMIVLNKKITERGNGETENGRNKEKLISPSPRVSGSEGQRENIVKLIRDGLATTKWPGRLEFIQEDPPILIDGAHNPAAAIALSKALEKNFLGRYKRIILILGIMGDKDIKGIMEPLLPLASEIILTSPDYERAASPARLADIAASLGFSEARTAPTVRDAIEMAIKIADCRMQNAESELKTIPNSAILNPKSLILITGSFYTIGEAKEAIGQKGVLTRLRE